MTTQPVSNLSDKTSEPIGTPLYRDTLARQAKFSKPEPSVWEPFPWLVNAFTDSMETERYSAIMAWCKKHCGDEARPYRRTPTPGRRWYSGNAITNGWTWFGFAGKPDHDAFIAKWEDVSSP